MIIGVAALLFFVGMYMKTGRDPPASQADPPAEETASPSIANEETPAPTPTPSPSAAPLPHIHHWTPKYSVEHQAAKGHYETVTVKEAWDEPQYGTGFVCSVCGAGFGDAGSAAGHIGSAHSYEGSYYQGTIQTGSIHHDAITEQRWVTDKGESNESVETGFICAECGETREDLTGLYSKPNDELNAAAAGMSTN